MRVMPAWRRAMGMGDRRKSLEGTSLLMGSEWVKSLSPGDPGGPAAPRASSCRVTTDPAPPGSDLSRGTSPGGPTSTRGSPGPEGQ